MTPAGPLPDLLPLLAARPLRTGEIGAAMDALLDPAVAEEPKTDFLAAWATRGETAAELAACAEALLPRAVDPGVRGSWNGAPLLDCCGTGGGGLDLINVSTGILFLLAALGVPAVKHGNRGVTKKSGSADVLEALGLRIDLPAAATLRCLEETGGAFLFAPACHPAFAVLAPVRRKLAAQGRRTVFNLLGPLLNPARPDARLVGVFRPEHVSLYAETLRRLGCPRYTVACGEDRASGRALGEVSASGPTLFAGTLPLDRDEDLERHPAAPGELESLLVTGAADGARRLEGLLRGAEKGLGRELLVANAAVAAWTQGAAASLDEALQRAAEALDSGRAAHVLDRWRHFSSRF